MITPAGDPDGRHRLYGVLAQLVGYQRHEIGIRMALGATRESMARMILRQGGTLVGAGLALGLGLSVLLGHFIRSGRAGVGAGGVAASLVPALRAASIEPMQALREE